MDIQYTFSLSGVHGATVLVDMRHVIAMTSLPDVVNIGMYWIEFFLAGGGHIKAHAVSKEHSRIQAAYTYVHTYVHTDALPEVK